MNAFGAAASHTIVSAMPDQTGAAKMIDPRVAWEIAQAPPSLTGKPSVDRYQAIARYLRRFDLVLSYNWGAMDGVMAKRLFGGPPLVHHEDGFNADEAVKTKLERNLFRRLALKGAQALVVPSARLEAIARAKWGASARLVRISNGIPTVRYAGRPLQPLRKTLGPKPGRALVGTLAGLREVKNLPRLVRAFAASGADADLAIVGEGPEHDAIRAAGDAAGLGKRLHLPGHLADPHRYIGHFDLFALSSDSEQQPISVIEAMAAGLPVAAPAVGDVADMVSEANRRFITAPGDERALAGAIRALIADADLRASIGAANQARALAHYDEAKMIAAYRALYAETLGRPGAFG
ncbi:glycosyltransferase [Sphingomonas gilva]|uniref:Glycosyltransferase n=2 Tax=Sphingomonas gilva TaxID=2305907 RepID=A0A396RNF6_9SPHN|nr:glycosyltransferase [Sphingomonas gilva]